MTKKTCIKSIKKRALTCYKLQLKSNYFKIPNIKNNYFKENELSLSNVALLKLNCINMYNQINNDSSSASDESIQKKVVASAAMNHSNQMIMDQIMVHRPVNTIKAYSAKQKKWKVSIFALG